MNLFKKYYFLAENQEIINEDIYGNKAVVYHRTRVENLVDEVYKKSFKPGPGAAYGKGFYSTYELNSQLNKEMENSYGPVIVKIMINSLNNFLILDYKEFIKSPVAKKINTNKDNFIYDQMKYFKFNKISSFEETIEEEIIKMKTDPDYFSSDLAMKIYFKYRYLNKFVDGMVFTGRSDSTVLVCYNTKLIIPLSFSKDNAKTWIKPTNKNINYLRKTFSQNTDTIKIENIKSNFNDPLIEKNKIKASKNSKFLIKKNHIEWLSGTWNDGTWEDGVWHDGTWKSGTWEKGIWNDGIWEKGTWLDGSWYIGTWKDGAWWYGTWHNGTWEGGEWNGGAWYKGTWKGGYDKFGDYHQTGDSPDKWILKSHWIYKAKISKDSKYTSKNGYIYWEDGTWHDGVWRRGDFLKGTWENGTWDFGVFGSLHEGIWLDGDFRGGTFRGKLWKNGNFQGSFIGDVWENGTFKGIWDGNTWLGGTWIEGSLWNGGYDKYGNYHEEDDSPDQWNLK
jgi:hypothetical protein